MSTAVASPAAALPVPIAPPSGAPGDAATGTPGTTETGSADFAALLFGQMAAEFVQLIEPPATQAIAAEGSDTALAQGFGTGAEITDPSLILTSIGLPPLTPMAAAPSRPANIATAMIETRDGRPAIPGLAILPTEQAASKSPLSASGRASAASTELPLASSLPSGSFLQTGADSETQAPAKLAGFAQVLADRAPTSTTIAVPENPQQTAAPLQAVAAAPRMATEAAHIETSIRQESWPAEFGQKVVWLATQDKQAAQITLNPPDLGPIEISLNLKNDQASAVFSSPHAEVREAIETAIPRLREMFAGVGIDLGQTNVNGESFRQAQEGQRERQAGTGGSDGDSQASGGIEIVRQSAARRGNGLVDTFA